MRSHSWILACMAAVGCSASSELPAPSPSRAQISLNSMVIDTRHPPAVPAQLRAAPDDPHVLVKLPGPVGARQLAELGAAVERIYTYLPDDTFLVKLRRGEGQVAALARLGATFTAPYHPAYKLSRFAAAVGAQPGDGSGHDEPQMLLLQLYPDADLDRAE